MICSYFKNKRKEGALGATLIFGGIIGVIVGALLTSSEVPQREYAFLFIFSIFIMLIFLILLLADDDWSKVKETIKTRKILLIGFLLSYTVMISLFHISKINPFGWWTLVVILLFGEILFFLDRTKKPKNTTRFKFTSMRKIEAISESALIILSVLGISYIVNKIAWTKGVQTISQGISNFWTTYSTLLLRMLRYAVLVVVIFIGIVIWIWINSFRYKEKKDK